MYPDLTKETIEKFEKALTVKEKPGANAAVEDKQAHAKALKETTAVFNEICRLVRADAQQSLVHTAKVADFKKQNLSLYATKGCLSEKMHGYLGFEAGGKQSYADELKDKSHELDKQISAEMAVIEALGHRVNNLQAKAFEILKAWGLQAAVIDPDNELDAIDAIARTLAVSGGDRPTLGTEFSSFEAQQSWYSNSFGLGKISFFSAKAEEAEKSEDTAQPDRVGTTEPVVGQ